jgi:hypothetical protein
MAEYAPWGILALVAAQCSMLLLHSFLLLAQTAVAVVGISKLHLRVGTVAEQPAELLDWKLLTHAVHGPIMTILPWLQLKQQPLEPDIPIPLQ